jgi:hypothetical protein
MAAPAETAPPVRETPLVALHPAPHNPRKITPERLEQLKRSLDADREMLAVRPEREFQGEAFVHPDVERCLGLLWGKLERVGAGLAALEQAVEHPSPSEENLVWARHELRLPEPAERQGSGARGGGVDQALLEQASEVSKEWKEEVERHKREGGSWR